MNETVQLIEDLADRALGRSNKPVVVSRPPTREALKAQLAVISANVAVNEMPKPAGRNRSLKRAVLKLIGFSTVRQQAVNTSLVNVLDALVSELDFLNAEIEQERRRSAAAIAGFELSVITANQHHREVVDRLAARVDEYLNADGLRSELDQFKQTLEGKIDDAIAEVVLEASRRRVLERHFGVLRAEMARLNGVGPGSTTEELDEIAIADLSEVYARFVARFRPPTADLAAGFGVYVDQLRELAGGDKPVLDIGAGRGELLRALADAQIPCKGVDLNPEAVRVAREAGLDVELSTSKDYLAKLADESIGAVTAVHFVEHLEPNELISLIDEIFRVLMPGGLLILETPNPSNLVVGASAFYNDPTHRRPVTPDYLAFLVHDRGLVEVQTMFLHPLPEFEAPTPAFDQPGFRGLELLLDDIRWAFKGPQDYAIIARRPGNR